MAIISKYPLKVLQEVEPFPPIQNTSNPYLTEAAMYADQANQLEGYGYLVIDVGAFTYLGTIIGDETDYITIDSLKDITLRSVTNSSSTIYFLEGRDDIGSFIRYNAATNFFEFGSEDGQGEVISARIDRGKTDWEFQDRIQIKKLGRGVTMYAPGGVDYELRVNEGGVLELWNLYINDLDALVWSSETSTGLDLRASNLASDLTNEEKDAIKTKVDINSYGLKVVNIDTQSLTTYDLLETSKIPTLYVFNNSGSTDGVLVTIKEGTTCPHIFISGRGFGGSTATLSIDFGININGFLPDDSTNKVNVNGTVELLLKDSFVFQGTAVSDYIYKGSYIKLFEIFESPNGTLYKVGVDDTGARTSIAL